MAKNELTGLDLLAYELDRLYELEKDIESKRPDLAQPEEFARIMQEISDNGDEEVQHSVADELLCVALELLGFGKGIEIYRHIGKWYA